MENGSKNQPVTAAIQLIDGQIVKMRFPDWESFGEWVTLNHQLFMGAQAEPEKGEGHV